MYPAISTRLEEYRKLVSNGATDYAIEGANFKGATGFHDKGDDREVLQISRSNCE